MSQDLAWLAAFVLGAFVAALSIPFICEIRRTRREAGALRREP